MQPMTTPLGELAAANPSATRVFLRHRLDFCCGGRRTLAEACESAGLNPQRSPRARAEACEADASRGGSQESELAEPHRGSLHPASPDCLR